ncbi:MAG: hypothetical protein HKN25_12560 [Pyrinomonadaceae bacterium]|nr:hypothetical protein [Pyrinomonadaceae bacterium]
MSQHENIEIDPDATYESNVVGVKGIIYFGIGLFLLIVVTFGLMWVFQFWVLEDQALRYDEENRSPVSMSPEEMLPPEPRLQSAPGFGVDTENGRVGLELREPQAEYEVVRKEWERLWKNGQKKDGTVISMPIEEAKQKVVNEKTIKTASEADGKMVLKKSKTVVSGANSGR